MWGQRPLFATQMVSTLIFTRFALIASAWLTDDHWTALVMPITENAIDETIDTNF